MERKILYVEDNPDAIVFFKRVINKLGDYTLQIVEDGDALAALVNDSNGKEIDPEIILLDINLPGMNGFEILQYLRSKTKYKRTPVIMFTSSDSESDIEKSYTYGANAYLVKPDNLQTMYTVLEDTFNFWLKHNVA
ncbi:MAG: response regulator [Agriterribacter sp.]